MNEENTQQYPRRARRGCGIGKVGAVTTDKENYGTETNIPWRLG